MSFGFSVGDFVTLSILIKDTISILRFASRKEYQNLISELDSVSHALDHLSVVTFATPSQNVELQALRMVASTFKIEISEFMQKVKKFEILGSDAGITVQERSKLFFRKLQFGLSMQDEVMRMRTRTAATVGFLNLRLTTMNLLLLQSTSSNQQALSNQMIENVHAIHKKLDRIGASVPMKLGSLPQQEETYLQKTVSLFSSYVPKTTALKQLLIGSWAMNFEILTFLRQERLNPRLETSFTWAQSPVRFEDAVGRILPIPSEYNWNKVRAIIRDQFKTGPGASKVAYDKYCVYASGNPLQVYGDDVPLVPGTSIVMAVFVGVYRIRNSQICPRPDCLSFKIKQKHNGLKECTSCGLHYDFGTSGLPIPLKFDEVERFPDSGREMPADCADALPSLRIERSNINIGMIRATRNARKSFKHVRLVPGASIPLLEVLDNRVSEATSEITQYAKVLPKPDTSSVSDFESPMGASGTASSMSRENQMLTQKFLAILTDVIDLPNLSEDELLGLSLNEMGLDSLLAVELALRLREELGTEYTGLVMLLMQHSLGSIRDLLGIVRSRSRVPVNLSPTN